MITWPIFVALFLAIIAVYVSIKRENALEKKEQLEDEKRKAKIAYLEKRKSLANKG